MVIQKMMHGKKEEVKRIKAEQGIVEIEEPAANMDLGGFGNGNGEPSGAL